MKNTALTLLFLISTNAFANTENARIAALEARLNYLEKRIEFLEQDRKSNPHFNSVYYSCSLSVFSRHYEITEPNQGLARHKVKKVCREKEDDIFCQDHSIKCQALR